ncbi:MAG: hypothetical protein Q8O42_17355 [Acidobacteriota bacterium]|nr:hypothetical protein [Acidobacteriota bacterium]
MVTLPLDDGLLRNRNRYQTRRELGLRGALFPGFKVGFDASTNGLLLATSVRGCQCADSVRKILTDGQRQPDELAAKLRRYELKGADPRRASQGLKDWHS